MRLFDSLYRLSHDIISQIKLHDQCASGREKVNLSLEIEGLVHSNCKGIETILFTAPKKDIHKLIDIEVVLDDWLVFEQNIGTFQLLNRLIQVLYLRHGSQKVSLVEVCDVCSNQEPDKAGCWHRPVDVVVQTIHINL